MAAAWELPDGVVRCPACGRFVEIDDGFGDHEVRGCTQRLAADPDLGVCGCYLETFCDETCADRFHGTCPNDHDVECLCERCDPDGEYDSIAASQEGA